MANPEMDKKDAVMRKKKVPAGTHIGLETMIKGEKKMRAITVPVTVRPVRRRKIDPVTSRVKIAASCVEFGACSCSLCRNGDDVVCLCVWAEIVLLRSAMGMGMRLGLECDLIL